MQGPPQHTSTALLAAVVKASDIRVGCTPFSSSFMLSLSSAPQMTTTEVVPSPATTSCSDSTTSRLLLRHGEQATSQMGVAILLLTFEGHAHNAKTGIWTTRPGKRVGMRFSLRWCRPERIMRVSSGHADGNCICDFQLTAEWKNGSVETWFLPCVTSLRAAMDRH